MRKQAIKSGLQPVGFKEADIIIVNSCTVTLEADRKTRQFLRRAIRFNPNAKLFVTGCYVEHSLPELKQEFPCAEFFGNADKPVFLDRIGVEYRGCSSLGIPENFQSRTRAFIKIQDGCDGCCAYCIVSKVRNKLWSKEFEQVIKEASDYVSAGYKEIVLCGIRLGKYRGRGKSLTQLLQVLEQIDGLVRIRLSSIDLNDIPDELILFMAASPKLCRHLHISLQSGSNKVLKDMRRPYTAEYYYERLRYIRNHIPDIGITTDIIVGFPTEEDAHFTESYKYVEKCGFSRLHVFPYSPRPGTEAVLMPRVCTGAELLGRTKLMSKLDQELRMRFKKKFAGRKLEVLTEGNGWGYTSNYIKVRLPAGTPENIVINYEE